MPPRGEAGQFEASTREVESGNFRKDLLYRLRVVALTIPPLRDRRGDILPLARAFLERKRTESGREEAFHLDTESEKTLLAHDWPGNVRELEHRITRAVTLASGTRLAPGDLGLTELGGVMPLKEALAAYEAEYLRETIRLFGGNISRTAEALGVSRQTLYNRIERLGIE